jgi:hypothetical protein
MNKERQKEQFTHPGSESRPIYYFQLPPISSTAEQLAEATRLAVTSCLQCGCGTLIPQLPFGTELDGAGLSVLQGVFADLLAQAAAVGLHVGFYLDPAFEHGIIRAMSEVGENGLRAALLHCKEYACSQNERIERKLSPGERVSLVAYSEDTGESLDLRPFVTNDRLVWQPPTGNYVIREYLVIEDNEREGANYLSYAASMGYIRAAFSLFSAAFAPYIGNTLSVLAYSGLGFNGRNRRSWDIHFNEVFEQRFGFDPAPYYPALFSSIGEETPRVKAYFMTVRASMLQNGIFKALHDFAKEQGLMLFGNMSEPKLTACSFSMGDTMLCNAFAPCALFDKAYMYGTNSVKIAAGAAYNFDIDRVCGELFRNYTKHDKARLLKDAMNAFARGVNCTGLHLTDELTADSAFCDFVARVQTMLQGGQHVSDIAMLYPIYHLHSHTGLYFSPAKGYEYPDTPFSADYMTLINSISIYSGHDLTLLHPEILNERCHTEGGILYLDNERNREAFRVVVLPCTAVISLQNLHTLKRFFDEGGKILATGSLPTTALEYDENGESDREVKRLTEEIFGHDACDPRVMRHHCYNQNDKGGEAIFLYFNASAVDGTRMTRSSTVNRALNAFELPFDIYLPGMPRLECTGATNSNFPEFRTIGLDRVIPGGGMLNHIHKHHKDHDIYYFTNTSDSSYNHHVLLRGAFSVEEWNPHTGKITERNSRLLSYKNCLYTTLRLSLDSGSSTFFYATPKAPVDSEIEIIESIGHLQTQHDTLMTEF